MPSVAVSKPLSRRTLLAPVIVTGVSACRKSVERRRHDTRFGRRGGGRALKTLELRRSAKRNSRCTNHGERPTGVQKKNTKEQTNVSEGSVDSFGSGRGVNRAARV